MELEVGVAALAGGTVGEVGVVIALAVAVMASASGGAAGPALRFAFEREDGQVTLLFFAEGFFFFVFFLHLRLATVVFACFDASGEHALAAPD